MDYTKDVWYKIGLGIAVISGVGMVTEIVLMYFGFNSAMVRFFIECALLTVGCLLMVSVKSNYLNSPDGEPLPMFNTVRIFLYWLYVQFKSKGPGKFFMWFAVILVSLGVVVLMSLGGYQLYCKNAYLNTAGYVSNDKIYNEYLEYYKEALKRGDEDLAAEYYEIVEKSHNANAENRRLAEEYGKSFTATCIWIVPLVIVDAVAITLLAVTNFRVKKYGGVSDETLSGEDNE